MNPRPMRRFRDRYLAKLKRRLAETEMQINTPKVKTSRKRDWLDDLFDYEAQHPIAFASPRALFEARLIAELDQVRRSRSRADRTVHHRPKPNRAASRRKTVEN